MQLSDLDRAVSPERIRNYSLILVVIYALAAVIWLASMRNGVDAFGKPVGYDYITFYAASELIKAGHPEAAWDLARMAAMENAIVPAAHEVFPWHYPPTFEVLVAPLAYMPYRVSLALCLAATFALYLALARRISTHPWALLVAAAFPAVFMNAMQGQNGFLTTGLLGFGLLSLDRRPWLAGLLVGLLVFKPHFGVLLPLLLLAQGRWRSIAGAAISSVSLCLASLWIYGVQPWLAFLANAKVVSAVLERGMLPLSKMPSIFVAAADAGLPLPAAYFVHGLVAVGLATLTVLAWRRPGPLNLKVALAIPAVLTVSPYCFDYDLVLLALPVGLLAEQARNYRLPAGVPAALVVAFATPMAFSGIAQLTHVHLMPVGILLTFWAAWRTLGQAAASEAAAGPSIPGRPAGLRRASA